MAKLTADSRASFETALIVASFAALFFLLPHGLSGDDGVRFDDVQQLVDGHLTDSRYSLVMPFLSTPFLLLGDLLGSSEDWWAARFNVIVVAIGTAVAFRLLRGRFDAGLLRKTVLVLLLASLLTNRLRDYNAEVLTATLVTLGILGVTTGRRVVLGWAAIVVGVVNTPAAVGGLALIAFAVAVRERRLRHLLPLAVAVALIMTEAWVRRGSPTDTGYAGDHGVTTLLPYSGKPGFSYPFVLGVLSILLSFGRGLVFFAPGLLLIASKRTRRLVSEYRAVVVALMLFLAGLVLVYAKWWAWYGGLSWGPRFFVFAAVPASLFVAVRLHSPGGSASAHLVTLLALALSAWVGVIGAIASLAPLVRCTEDGYAVEAFCWYVPEYSSLWQPVLDFPTLTASTSILAAQSVIVFAYLAAPLVTNLASATRRSQLPAAASLRHWRI